MKKIILSALAIVVFASFSAQAQTVKAETSQTVTINLQNQIDIEVVPNTATGTEFTFSSTDEYASGLTNVGASQFLVRSNKAWTVTVAAVTADFTGGSTATPMPSRILGVRLKDATTFTSLSTTAAPLTSGAKGKENFFTVDYNANPGFDYEAGVYKLSVVYTATQQ